jgi:hypothetical protein
MHCWLGGNITVVSNPVLDNSQCGQPNVKWGICGSNFCAYKSSVKYPTTCLNGINGGSYIEKVCVDNIPYVGCPSGYTYTATLNICYKVVNTATNANSASLGCATSGGVLMSPSNAARNTFMVTTIGGGGNSYWIGLVIDVVHSNSRVW